jgi:hypothetical protein
LSKKPEVPEGCSDKDPPDVSVWHHPYYAEAGKPSLSDIVFEKLLQAAYFILALLGLLGIFFIMPAAWFIISELPWIDLNNRARIILVLLLCTGLISQYGFFAKMIRYPEDTGIISLKFIFMPFTFFGFSAVASALGLIHRDLTIGAFLGDLFSVFYFPAILTLGLMKAGAVMMTPEGDATCMASRVIGEALGPTGLLHFIYSVIQLIWDVLVLPLKNPEIYEKVFSEFIDQPWHNMNWQGSLNISTYAVMVGYVGVCAVRGAVTAGAS